MTRWIFFRFYSSFFPFFLIIQATFGAFGSKKKISFRKWTFPIQKQTYFHSQFSKNWHLLSRIKRRCYFNWHELVKSNKVKSPLACRTYSLALHILSASTFNTWKKQAVNMIKLCLFIRFYLYSANVKSNDQKCEQFPLRAKNTAAQWAKITAYTRQRAERIIGDFDRQTHQWRWCRVLLLAVNRNRMVQSLDSIV